MEELTAEIVRELLRYEPDTGRLFWRERDRRWFQTDKVWKWWNGRFAEKEAFTALNCGGYKNGAILGKGYLAQRIIWLLETGEWPVGEVDHINGDKIDNRLENLRDVSKSDNQRNAKKRRDCASGVTGVSWHKVNQKWRAYINTGGRIHNAGYFKKFEDAVAARRQAEQRFGYHPNHGRA